MSVAWCMTWHNYTPESRKRLEVRLQKLLAAEKLEYAIFSAEVGKKGETPHLQGYFRFITRAASRQSVSRRLGTPVSVHFEKAKGAGWQNVRYVLKDETIPDNKKPYTMDENKDHFEIGDRPLEPESAKESKTKRDFKEALAAFREAGSSTKVLMEDPNLAYVYSHHMRFFDKLAQEAQAAAVPLWRAIQVHVFWGPTGTGKSRTAMESALATSTTGQVRVYTWQGSGVHWWQDYVPGDGVVFDEFDPIRCPVNLVKRYFDGYRFVAEHKGGSRVPDYTHLYITSNTDPATWYQGLEAEHYDAVQRRLTHITHCRALGDHVVTKTPPAA